MPVAGRALPELLRRPGLLRAWVLEVHLGAAPLATDGDVGVIHGEILLFPSAGVQPDRIRRGELA